MKFLSLVSLFLVAGVLSAQTACTNLNPCVQLALTNPNTLPGATVLWVCVGSATSCSQTALNAIIAQQTPTNLCPIAQSVWRCASFSQTKTPQNYNDPEPWGSLMNYAAQGTLGGGVSAASPILTFQVPNAPAQPPSINGLPTMVNTGNSGPQ